MTTVPAQIRRPAWVGLALLLAWGAGGETSVAAQPIQTASRCAIGVAARTGTAAPDVASDAALRRTLLAAGTIAFTGDEASGAAFRDMLDALGIARQIEPRLVDTGNGDPLELVAQGRADLGVSSPSRIASTTGVRALVPLPIGTSPGSC